MYVYIGAHTSRLTYVHYYMQSFQRRTKRLSIAVPHCIFYVWFILCRELGSYSYAGLCWFAVFYSRPVLWILRYINASMAAGSSYDCQSSNSICLLLFYLSPNRLATLIWCPTAWRIPNISNDRPPSRPTSWRVLVLSGTLPSGWSVPSRSSIW